ncbi:MAG: hypothetical protein OHK0039_46560 [Bacteroidia bacterium]
MAIDIQLKPDPILTATVEVRFTAAVASERWMGKITAGLLQRLPLIQAADLSAAVKRDHEAFRHLPSWFSKTMPSR